MILRKDEYPESLFAPFSVEKLSSDSTSDTGNKDFLETGLYLLNLLYFLGIADKQLLMVNS